MHVTAMVLPGQRRLIGTHDTLWGKRNLGRGNSRCKGPEAKTCQACARESKVVTSCKAS